MLRSPGRAQGLSERQRVRNRSELRLLLDGLAYLKLGYRQQPTTWLRLLLDGLAYLKLGYRQQPTTWKKKDGARPRQGIAEHTRTHYGFMLANARKNLRSLAEQTNERVAAMRQRLRNDG